MDRSVIRKLKDAGIDSTFEELVPVIGIRLDGDERVMPLRDQADVVAGNHVALISLKTTSELWTGDAPAPDLARGPTPEYLFFFALIERTAADFCSCTGMRIRDQEFERLYNHLRRRPDGTDANPLFSYLQAATRLYMSLRDVSQAEFEAVARRLTRSARAYSEGVSSTNYTEFVLERLLAK